MRVKDLKFMCLYKGLDRGFCNDHSYFPGYFLKKILISTFLVKDNWKIRFNASLASCVIIENTRAPLLVIYLDPINRMALPNFRKPQ